MWRNVERNIRKLEDAENNLNILITLIDDKLFPGEFGKWVHHLAREEEDEEEDEEDEEDEDEDEDDDED